MEQGQFYFITDDYFIKYDVDQKLMRNVEIINGKRHGRPCFYAFSDKVNSDIFWCVPISSQLEKFTQIYDNKILKQREKGINTPRCNTIRFGEVMGAKKAFLIQNMFPVIEKYIDEVYINNLTQTAVRIAKNIEQDIIKMQLMF